MDVPRGRGRGRGGHDQPGRGRPLSRNKQWVANPAPEGERWERGRGRGRGTYRGSGRGRPPQQNNVRVEEPKREPEPELETAEEREAFFKQLVKEREEERNAAIAAGLMDDPNVRKRLEDAIVIKGTCRDMCPRFERYRRERENNLMFWEQIPGSNKRVDHARAVKMYERAAGDKIIPSDIRPPEVLKRTLDYLFHDLLTREGQVSGEPSTLPFIRDRSRAVRNDFVLQHDSGPIAMECHERCARFHILSLHLGKLDIATESQQLMNTLQTLKEYYLDQRGVYEFRCELEMRVYHRLANMRDQVERHDKVPEEILTNPVYNLANQFREHVQKVSGKITKASALQVDEAGMAIFGELATVLKNEGNVVMIFLIACILELVFGKDTIEDIENIREGLTNSDIIDGYSTYDDDEHMMEDIDGGPHITEVPSPASQSSALPASTAPPPVSAWPTTATTIRPEKSAFANLVSTSAFSGPSFGQPVPAFGDPAPSAFPQSSAFTNVEPPAPVANAFTPTTFPGFGPQTTSPFGAPSSSFFNKPAEDTTSTSVSGPTATTTGPFGAPSASFFNKPPTEDRPSSVSQSTPSNIPSFFSNIASSSTPPQPEIPNFFSKPSSQPSSTSFSPPPPATSKPEQIPNFFAPKPSSQASSIPNFFANKETSSSPAFSLPTSSTTTPIPFSLSPPQSGQTQPTVSFSLPTPTPSPVPASAPDPPSNLNPFAAAFVPSVPQSSTPAASGPPASSIPSTEVKEASTSKSIPTFAAPAPLNGFLDKMKPVLAGVAGGTNPPPSFGTILFSQPGEKVDIPAAPTPIVPAFTQPTSPKEKEHALRIDTTPQAPKLEPISLPGTPTVTEPSFNAFASSSSITSFSPSSSKKKRPPIITATLPEIAPSEVLSPLVLHSPTLSRSSSMRGFNSPSSSFVLPSPPSAVHITPTSPPVNGRAKDKGKGKGKEKASSNLSTSVSASDLYGDDNDDEVSHGPSSHLSRKDEDDMPPEDDTDLAYREAVEAADKYSETVAALRSSQSRTSPDRHRKRTLSSIDSPTSQNGAFEKKRRKRVSRSSGEFQQARSDEDLVRRFTQNQEDHKRRWAPGSFLQVVREKIGLHLATVASVRHKALSASWTVWLSLNPDFDATAIWLECKFGMPNSGRWVDKGVFSIRGAENSAGKDDCDHDDFPGVIIFECTPLENAADELECKYRILDDCARLRDMIAILPPKRHFVPALLVIRWTEEGRPTPFPDGDFTDMVSKLIAQSVISGCSVFEVSSSTKDLDYKFANALRALDFDVEGRLVRMLTVRGVFKLFEAVYTVFREEWLEKCTLHGSFGWGFYARLLQAVIELSNSLAGSVQLLIASERIGDCLPSFEADPLELSDSDSMYDAATSWLENAGLGPMGDSVIVDLTSHRDMDRAFPTQVFFGQVYELVQRKTEEKLDATPKSKFPIPTSDISVAVEQFQASIAASQSKLNFTWSLSVRRSPKRRSLSEVTDSTTTESKRRRLSTSVESSPDELTQSIMSTPRINGRDSPSPTSSVVSLPQSESSSSIVTVAMLRALTKNLKQKYGNIKS